MKPVKDFIVKDENIILYYLCNFKYFYEYFHYYAQQDQSSISFIWFNIITKTKNKTIYMGDHYNPINAYLFFQLFLSRTT